jgi:acetoin utilization deacetylase AcuC-like enzyme
MEYGVVLDNVFTQHVTPPGHPERPERITALIDALDGWSQSNRVTRYPPVIIDQKWILKIHSGDHYRVIQQTAGDLYHALEPDTHTGPKSFETALLAAGSGIRLLDLVNQGEIRSGFLLARPPGHHAETNRAMGFCLFNNVAAAAEWALTNGMASRVAIVDFDVHHGNGTQEIFSSRPDVLFISSHQYPFYPGTGAFHDVGKGPGEGYSVNFPVPAGKGDFFYASLYREFVAPILVEYEPELILVSAGFDAHRDDFMAGMQLSLAGYEHLAEILNETANLVAAGKILYFLEGGYNLQALADSVLATITTSLDSVAHEIAQSQEDEYAAYREKARRMLRPYWRCLQ